MTDDITKLETRRLVDTDSEAFVKLLKEQKTYFGLPIKQFPVNLVSPLAIRSYIDNYLTHDHPYLKSFGAFNDGKLVGSITVDLMFEQPFWILRRIVVEEELKATKTSSEIMNELMISALTVAEQAGYYQHINLIPAKYRKAHLKIWGSQEARKDRYDVFEVEYVKANSPSRFRMFWENLYGRIHYPLDTVVRMSVLRGDLRPNDPQ